MQSKLTLSLIAFFLFCHFSVSSQNYYWVSFKDKNNTPYKLTEPQEFLSHRAIERRERQGISIDSLDLPVNKTYIDQVLALNATLVHQSKWMNGITVSTSSYNFNQQASSLSFVKDVELTKPSLTSKSTRNKFNEKGEILDSPIDTSKYGNSAHQVGQLNAHILHNNNYQGQGMLIAVLDVGYSNAKYQQSLKHLWQNDQIIGTKNFVDDNRSIFSAGGHGTSVLSCMGGYDEGVLIGTSPKANFWLLRTEDVSSEYPIEEDNWVAAAEFADSAGVDVINSSLGYNVFDDPSMDHSYSDMDGETIRASIAADIAFEKGILVFISAGNDGNSSWKYLAAPSDGDNVICVGSVDKYGYKSSFSSFGPSADNDVKPNLVAMGSSTVVQSSSGYISRSNGTSFACPVLCGAATSLWQAKPDATAVQIKDALEKSASQYNHPDDRLGYGIPDMEKALQILNNTSSSSIEQTSRWRVYPNPFTQSINIMSVGNYKGSEVSVELLSESGKSLERANFSNVNNIKLNTTNNLPVGIYFVKITDNSNTEVIKLNKIGR